MSSSLAAPAGVAPFDTNTMDESNTNISDAAGKIAPWQYKWKRPRVAHVKPLARIVGGDKKKHEDKLRGHQDVHRSRHHDLHERVLKKVQKEYLQVRKQLKDKIPISATSYRLNKNEARIILQGQEEKFGNAVDSTDGNNKQKDSPRSSSIPFKASDDADGSTSFRSNMKWEDLESESDEDENAKDNDNEKARTDGKAKKRTRITKSFATRSSSAAINQGVSNAHGKGDKDDDYGSYIASVTTFASKRHIEMIETCTSSDSSTSNKSIMVPADTILIEIIQDSYSTGTDSSNHSTTTRKTGGVNHSNPGEKEVNSGEMGIVLSKLLYWPSSALVNMDTNILNVDHLGGRERGVGEDVREIIDHDLHVAEEDGEGLEEDSSLAVPCFHEDRLKILKQIQSACLSTIRSVLHLPKSLENMTIEEQQKYAKRQMSQQLNFLKKRVGVTGICLSRPPPSTHTGTDDSNDSGADTKKTVDFDAAMDVLDQMTLGIGLNLEPDILARSTINNQNSLKSSEVQNAKDDLHQGDGELILTCLCSDDRVHIFPLLDLLFHQKKDPTLTEKEVEFVSAINGRKDRYDSLFVGFEQLLIGTYLTKSLQNDFLPLSNPKATIDLAVTTMKGRLPAMMGVSVDGISDEDGKKDGIDAATSLPNRSSIINEFGNSLQEFQPKFELSFLDATIESSTIHDRTINNTTTICTSAFSYIVVAGKGTRKYRRKRESESIEEEGIKSTWEDVFLPGGFISLISTDYYTETRTIFLPFEPKLISPIRWKSAELILVMGESDNNSRAIRIDSSSYLTISEEIAGSTKDSFGRLLHRPPKVKRYFVKKFTPFQISFSEMDRISSSASNTNIFPLSISSLPTDPPYIVLGSINENTLDIQLFSLDSVEINDYRAHNTALFKGSSFESISLCAKHETRHKAKISLREYIDISTDDLVLGRSCPSIRNENIWCVSGQGWSILGLEILSRLIVFFISWEGASQVDGAFCEEIAILEMPQRNIARNISNSISFHRRIIDAPNLSTLSPDRQIALALLRMTDQNKTNLAISMRSNVILNGPSSPFQEVLSWLCEHDDHFTAANIALRLLEDKETLEDLNLSTKYFQASGDLKSWDALLDGVDQLDIEGFQKIHRCDSSTIKTPLSMGSMMTYEDRLRQQTCVNLSNMTVTCLVNGGAAMAHTLDKFLRRNEFYDAPTACRILVSVATDIIDNMSLSDMEYLAPYSYNPMECEGHALWAIQGLLHVAVARDCMHTALMMLDKKIPDILRHRLRKESEKVHCRSSLYLSKSIISMILASSEFAASELMALVETGTRKLYWESLDRETRMSLSLTHVQGRYPMLREREVRNWALELLHIATGLIHRSDINDMEEWVPSDWLRELCTASLSNAGCDLSQTILFTPILSLSDDSGKHDENAMLQKWQEDEEDLYDYLAADPGCGGIDFDHLIPALLLLESRNDQWVGNGPVSSQSILNIACDLAGRQSFEEPRFAFDNASVMKQCALMKNVLAAANLLGGRNGLVLKCSQVLISQGGLNMKEAEQYLLSHSLPNFSMGNSSCSTSKQETGNNDDKSDNDNRPYEFILSDGHKMLLWLLEKHVLNIKRYGDFHAKYRGQIDPIFAARMCLRTWLFLMQSYAHSGPWLEAWLTERLDLDIHERDARRLPYAAIIRALLWSEDPSEATSVEELEASPVLAMSLGFSLTFVVNLTRVPCGLLESVPAL